MSTKEFKLICMRTMCDQKVFSVWKSECDVRGTPCPKCGYDASLVRVPMKCDEHFNHDEVSPQLAISSDEEKCEALRDDETSSQLEEEDNMLSGLEELQK